MTRLEQFITRYRPFSLGLATGLLCSVAVAQSDLTNQAVTSDLRLKPIYGYQPTWSPDGRKIAFLRRFSDPVARISNIVVHIFVMNVDGTSQRQVTRIDNFNESFSWSPDSSRIVFESDRDHPFSLDINNPQQWELYVINADGTGVRRLTNSDQHSLWPAWSPDGKTIAYTTGASGSAAIYQMNPDGSGQTRLSAGTGKFSKPAWSPDGSKIAMLGAGFRDFSIYLMDANGSGIVKLADTPGRPSDPAWSPNGSMIAFSAEGPLNPIDCENDWDKPDQIYVVTVRSGKLKQLTHDCDRNSGPSWSPDGLKIIFAVGPGKPSIYLMDADGDNKTQMTDVPVF